MATVTRNLTDLVLKTTVLLLLLSYVPQTMVYHIIMNNRTIHGLPLSDHELTITLAQFLQQTRKALLMNNSDQQD